MVQKEAILDVVREQQPITSESVTDELFDGDKHCSECGVVNSDYAKFAGMVTERLNQLNDENRVITGSNWEYRTPK